MEKTWVRSPDPEDPLKEEMATHSSILAWEISWTEEPGEPEAMELQESDMTEHTCTHTNSFKSFQISTKSQGASEENPPVLICWSFLDYRPPQSVLSDVQLFSDSRDCSLPGSSVHEISQARILAWVAISFSRVSP